MTNFSELIDEVEEEVGDFEPPFDTKIIEKTIKK